MKILGLDSSGLVASAAVVEEDITIDAERYARDDERKRQVLGYCCKRTIVST